jgi:histone acetyltransferase 1
VLILPPFQGIGVGTKLLETIYEHFQKQDNVTDITVEDGSEDFQRIRCTLDAKLCKDLESFSPDVIKNGLSKNMLSDCQKKYKVIKYL